MVRRTVEIRDSSADGLVSGYQRTHVTTAGSWAILETGGYVVVGVIELPESELLFPDELISKELQETPRGPIFMDADRQKLELDITQEFEFADGEAILLIDETK